MPIEPEFVKVRIDLEESERHDLLKSIMKYLFLLLIILMSYPAHAQQRKRQLHPALSKEYKKIKKLKVDTIFSYYKYCIGCEILSKKKLSKDCREFIDAQIFWKKDGKSFSKSILCDGTEKEMVTNTFSKLFEYLVLHEKELTSRDGTGEFLPPIPAHATFESLTVSIDLKVYNLLLADQQRMDEVWKKYGWIKPTIEIMDLAKAN